MTAWLVIATDGAKRVGEGYDDDPSRHYSWDSTVPNHGALRPNDVIALWDTHTLLGLSVIETIDIGEAQKKTPFCEFCGKADVAARKTMTPTYRCWTATCRKEFNEPGWITKDVTTFTSRHEAGWIPLPGTLTGAELRKLCEQTRSQNSLRRLRWDAFQQAIADSGTHTPLHIVGLTQEVITGGHRTTTVRARIGQPTFRRQLLDTFGENCAFTGPAPAPALEAAHLYSYATKGKHHRNGGLLLRRDLHRLFDLGLIAVDPSSQTLDVASDLAAFPDYSHLQGKPLTVPVTKEHMRWLSQHWDMHRPTRKP